MSLAGLIMIYFDSGDIDFESGKRAKLIKFF